MLRGKLVYLPRYILLEWRNWYTRTLQERIPQGLRVQISPPAQQNVSGRVRFQTCPPKRSRRRERISQELRVQISPTASSFFLMEKFKKYIRGKKITVMGLGLLGSGLGDIEFLAKQGVRLLVTDLKSKSELASSLKKLKKYKNIKYVLGKHRLEDFENCDMVLKAGGVPLDSPYIAAARRLKIPVEMSASLFAKFSPATIIGVTGTRGKTTVTNLIYQILRKAKKKAWLGGNIQGLSTLSFLPLARPGDFVVMELDSWRLQGFGEAKISPHISVFTNFLPDHLNYYLSTSRKTGKDQYLEDKANIFKYQTKKDVLILGSQCAESIQKKYLNIKSEIVIPNLFDISNKLKMPGEHNRYNAALAAAAAQTVGVSEKIIRLVIEKFPGIPGRLELVRAYKSIKIYNDTTATTPAATLAALRALEKAPRLPSTGLGTRRSGQNKHGKVVLILGGVDKGINMRELVNQIPRYCKSVVLLPGTGTEEIRSKNYELRIKNNSRFLIKNAPLCKTLAGAIRKAIRIAKSGDIILFSPAFASFGMFKNEYDRGEQFNELIKGLK